MLRLHPRILLAVCLLLPSPGALAYVGPTLGLGVVGTVVAVIAVALLSLAAFVILPLRRLLRKSRKKPATSDREPSRDA